MKRIFTRAVAFMDLGLLLVANLIMRTKYTVSGASKPSVSLMAILKDVPYLIFILGVFLVRHPRSGAKITPLIAVSERSSGEHLFHVSIFFLVVTNLETLFSLLPPILRSAK